MIADFNKKFTDSLLSLLGVENLCESKYVVGVSGGVDSMVCLRAMVECVGAERIIVAHCNFGLREQATIETEMVEKTCQEWGVRCEVARFDTASECERRGEGVQVVARDLRYGFFEELCLKHGAEYIVIGHNREDCSETFFINLMRGSGLKGLKGMPHRRERVLRPMVFASRGEIVEYAQGCSVPHMEDGSNAELYYLRNKLRHNILPDLRELDTDFDKTLAGVCAKLSESYDFQQTIVAAARERVFKDESLVIERFLKEDGSSAYLLYLLLQDKGFSHSMSQEIYRDILLGSSAQGNTYQGLKAKALIDRGHVLFEDIDQQQNEEFFIDKGQVEILERSLVEDLRSGVDFAYFDFAKLSFPLSVRPWKQGDRLAPYGMGGKEKLVSDILIDSKLSKFEKQRQLVVLSGNTIIWLVGLRTSHHAAVDHSSVSLAKVSLKH